MRLIFIALFFVLLAGIVNGNVIINEINANPFTNDSIDEWIEIYNDGNEDINLSNWKIEDKVRDDILSDGILKAEQYGIITAKGTLAYLNYNFSNECIQFYVGDTNIGGGLNNENETIFLLNLNGIIVDTINYSTSKKDKTYSRLKNDSWMFANPTMGYENEEMNYETENISEKIVLNESRECDWNVNVILEKTIFRDDFSFRTEMKNSVSEKSNLKLRRKITNGYGEIVEEYNELSFEAVNTRTLTNTPNLGYGIYSVEAFLDADCDIDDKNNYDKEFFMIIGEKEERRNESEVKIERIYDLGKDNHAKQGQQIRVKISGYKGNTAKEIIKVYFLNNKERVSKETTLNVEDKFQNYSFVVPLLVPENCDFSNLTLHIEGLNEDDNEVINLEKCSIKDEILDEENYEIQNETTFVYNENLNYESSSEKLNKIGLPFLVLALILLIIYLIFIKRKSL